MSFATSNDRNSQSSTSVRQFEYSEILSATNNFDELFIIGRGGSGTVYKGTIFNGSTHVEAAFKRLKHDMSRPRHEFLAEIKYLSQIRHRHIISLFGYCLQSGETIIVVEHMTNGSLYDNLHQNGINLTWIRRLGICIAVACGVNYLHTGLGDHMRVIHRDIKSSNVLLNKSWDAKIYDFRLACKEGTDNVIKGTIGYLDPNYFESQIPTMKTDVYAFGVVLCEVLCGKRPVFKIGDEVLSLTKWVQESIKNGDLERIIDSDIRGDISPESLKAFVGIVERCLHTSPEQRPTMVEVVVSLEDALGLQEKTNQSLPTAGHFFSRISLGIRKFWTGHALETSEAPAELRIQMPSSKVFTYADLETATSNFRQYIPFGCGGFRQVMFVGWVDETTFAPSREGVGIFVAVKRCNLDISQGQWLGYVSLLERLDHENIVSLLGYCIEHKYFLVYNHMEDRSYDRFLFRGTHYISEPLSFQERVHILIGVARGITYLHSLKDQVVCGVVRSSDILLDQNLNAKLGNFGLTIFGHQPGDTIFGTKTITPLGYIDQHYFDTGSLSVKTDIYGFGAVMLETLTGLPAWDMKRPEEQLNLVKLATPFLANTSELHRIMDPSLNQNYPVESAFKCASLALRCCADEPKDRPSSKEVLASLKQIFDGLREGQP